MRFVFAIALFIVGAFTGAWIMGSSYQEVRYRPVDVLVVEWNDNQVLTLEPIGRDLVEGELVERLRNLGFTAGLVEVNCTGPMEMRFARIDGSFYSLNGASQHPAFAVMNYGGQGECPIFCVTALWSMLPERSKDDDDFQGTAGRTSEGLRAA